MANPRIPYRFSNDGPALQPHAQGHILVHLVVNVEHWQFDAPMPRTIITPPHGKETVPDVPNFSWVDYGMRAGLPRIIEAIMAQKLAPGARLGEQQLAMVFDCSRTIVREALTRLAARGIDFIEWLRIDDPIGAVAVPCLPSAAGLRLRRDGPRRLARSPRHRGRCRRMAPMGNR